MQADEILKEPPPWVSPPSASQAGGERVEGGGWGRTPPLTPLVTTVGLELYFINSFII